MKVIEHVLGTGPKMDEALLRALGRRRWVRLLQELAAMPLVTLPTGWTVVDGRVEVEVRVKDTEELMRPAGPSGQLLPRRAAR